MKKVVVTGASKGIGFAIAKKFAKNNYAVTLCARNEAELQNAAHEIHRETGNLNIYFHICDVSKMLSLQKFHHFVMEKMGAPDILVNNAGIFVPGQIFNEDFETLELQLNTNVLSAYRLTKLFLPEMMRNKSGHIFNMCSTASITPYTNGGSYCISKYALYGMTKVLREEMKPYNIKVTAILPGATFTNSWLGTDLPEERFMNAGDVADAVFMCSNLSPSAVIEEILMRPQQGDI